MGWAAVSRLRRTATREDEGDSRLALGEREQPALRSRMLDQPRQQGLKRQGRAHVRRRRVHLATHCPTPPA